MDLSTRYLKCVYTPVKQSTSPSHADTIMQIPTWSLLLYELTQDQKQTATRRNHGKCVSLHSCVKERKGGRSDCSVKQLWCIGIHKANEWWEMGRLCRAYSSIIYIGLYLLASKWGPNAQLRPFLPFFSFPISGVYIITVLWNNPWNIFINCGSTILVSFSAFWTDKTGFWNTLSCVFD